MAKILHITESLGGGVAQAVSLLMRAQANGGHHTILIYARRTDTPSEQELDRMLPVPIERHVLPMVREISPVSDVAAIWGLKRLIRQIKPDIIHLHSSKAGALGRLAMFPCRGSKVFYSPHGLSFHRKGVGKYGPGIYKIAEWLLARLCGQFVAVSLSEKGVIEKALSLSGVKVLENAVELDSIPRRSERPPRESEPLKVVTVGRICDAKAPWRFAELAQRLGDRCQFVWIGDGDQRAEWLVGTPVEVTGWLTTNEVKERVSKADIFVLLSKYEGLPIALVESQVSGLPAIVTDVVGNRDVVVHGMTGFRVEDVNGAEAMLKWFLDHPEEINSMGAVAAVEARKRFDAKFLVQRSMQIYGLNSN